MARFRSGNYSTKFIPTEYPQGFHGVKLNKKETSEFIALAAAIHSARTESQTAVKEAARRAREDPAYLQARQQARQRHHLAAAAAVAAPAGDDAVSACCDIICLFVVSW